MSVAALHCSILGTIAAFWIKLLEGSFTPPPPAPRLTPTPPCPLIPKEIGPSLSAQTPHPEGPYQGKLDQGGPFVSQHSANRKKKSKLFLELEQFDML